MQNTINFKIAYMLAMSKVETTAMLCIASWLMAVDFITGVHDRSVDYIAIWQLGSKYFWCYTFALYALIKTITIFGDIDYRIALVNGVVGLWGWLYICLSFMLFDTSTISPHELVFLLPVIAESWLLLSYQKRGGKG